MGRAARKQPLRLVTTNDYYGSYFPHPTSYGVLPGAAALLETVDRLREDGPALWIDCGDFAQGGPLAPISAGSLGFVAARQLGIDVATIGNHELDWGPPHLRRWVGAVGFPVVCANLDLGFPASMILTAGGWSVGVIGLTHPGLATFHPEISHDQPDPADLVRTEADRLRREGVDRVVVAMHDGVDWAWTAEGAVQPRPERIAALLASFGDAIDLVLGGHTLARWIGPLGDVPFVQPWAFGAEVGVADLFAEGSVELSAVSVSGDAPWTGTGASVHAALRSEIVGELALPLVNGPMTDRSLPAAVAEGMCRVTGADVALVSPAEYQTMQPPIDGAFAYLPAGPVSEADVVRAIPWLDDAVVVAEVTAKELECLVAFLAEPERWASYGSPEVAGQIAGRTGTAAMNGYHARRLGERLERPIAWSRVCGQRDALRAAVAR